MVLPRCCRYLVCLLCALLVSHGVQAGHLGRHRQYRDRAVPREAAASVATVSAGDQLTANTFPTEFMIWMQNIATRLAAIEEALGMSASTILPSFPGASQSSQASVTLPVHTSPFGSFTSGIAKPTTRSKTPGSMSSHGPLSTLHFVTISDFPVGRTSWRSLATPSPAPSLQIPKPLFTDWADCEVPNNPYCSTSTLAPLPTVSGSRVLDAKLAAVDTMIVTSTITMRTTITVTISTADQISSTAALVPTASPTFNLLATTNIAVYYGVTAATTPTTFLNLCANPFISIINLAFLPTFFGPNNYPSTSFDPLCHPSTSKTSAGLQNCTLLGEQITTCQRQHNKLILVSLGGSIASSSFASESQAKSFARTLWKLFGPPPDEEDGATPRPFGTAIVDGFDIDNEDHSTLHWDDFATALRETYSADPTRRYYISAAPQCPRPDASIPETLLRAADFVWVQFYNNPKCQLGSGRGFLDSYAAWSRDLAGGEGERGPRLFIGTGAWRGAGSGYVDGHGLRDAVEGARAMGVGNLGGIMMWDGAEGMANLDEEGRNYIKLAHDALR